MLSEFDVLFEEFSRELDALAELAGGARSGDSSAFTPRARVAAGNGALLLLAAIFEEHIRQQVRAAFRNKTKNAKSFEDLPEKLASIVWRKSLELLARKPFEDVRANIRRTEESISATQSFCLRQDLSASVSEQISHNENNMRPGELNRLFNQIGIKSVISEVTKDKGIVIFLACDTPGKANTEIQSMLEDFFIRRNEIAHAIQLGSSSGPIEIQNDIDLFREFSRALANTLNMLA